jgi:hypothetical protein
VRLLCCASTVGAGGGEGVSVSVGNGDKEKADSFNCGCKSGAVFFIVSSCFLHAFSFFVFVPLFVC